MVEKLMQVPSIHEISVKGQRILDSLPEEVGEEHFTDMGDYIEFFRLSQYNYDVIKFKNEITKGVPRWKVRTQVEAS